MCSSSTCSSLSPSSFLFSLSLISPVPNPPSLPGWGYSSTECLPKRYSESGSRATCLQPINLHCSCTWVYRRSKPTSKQWVVSYVFSCRSVCDKHQNDIKWSMSFLRVNQGIKVTREWQNQGTNNSKEVCLPLWITVNQAFQEPQKGAIKQSSTIFVKDLNLSCKKWLLLKQIINSVAWHHHDVIYELVFYRLPLLWWQFWPETAIYRTHQDPSTMQ